MNRSLWRAGLLCALAVTRNAAAQPVARVGERTIEAAELAEAVERALNARYFHAGVGDKRRTALRREELARLLRGALDQAGGIDRGLSLPIAEARRQRALIEEQLGKVEYERSIAVRGWTRDDHEKVLARTLLAREAHRRFVEEPATVAQGDVEERYVSRLEKLVVPESRRIAHILLAVPLGSPEPAWRKREEAAAAIVARLRRGESFAAIAEESSDAPHRVKGGDLGWVHRGRLEEPVESAAWATPVGSLAGPLRGEDGFHVVFVAECRDARPLTIEEAAPRLNRELEEERLRDAEARWYGEVRAAHPIEILDPALKGTEP